MPTAITLIATFASAAVGTGVVSATAIFYGVSAALYLGVSIGLQFLAQALLKPSAPKPEDVQQSFRQPYQPRVRHYGRVKVAGPWVFGESKNGAFYKVIALGQGPIDAIEEYWVDDELVTLDAGGWTENGKADGEINIQTRLGIIPETHYSTLAGEFPEWTAAHRGDGVASLMSIQRAVSQEDFLSMFPNGINTNYRVVLRGAKVLHPQTGVTAWSDNAGVIIRDYMTHPDGMRLPGSILSTAQAATGWYASINWAAEDVPLKAGGTEDRYRLWGSYYLNERPADVLGRMLAACDGRLYPTADGGLALDIGHWREPTIILDENAIVGFSDFARGKDILNTANTIRGTYTDQTQDYQTTDADPWVNAADVSARGEIESEVSFIMAPSHSQCRRLMKLAAWRADPEWVGTFQTNLTGLAAIGERLVRIRYPLFGLDAVFEVQNLQLIVGEGNILQGVTLEVISLPYAAYSWDASQEEGDAPVSTGTTVDHTIPLPTGFTATLATKMIGGASVFYAALSWDPPPVASFRVQARGKRTAASTWTTITVTPGAEEADSFTLSDGEEYEFQIRHTASGGRPGDWTPSEIVTAV